MSVNPWSALLCEIDRLKAEFNVQEKENIPQDPESKAMLEATKFMGNEVPEANAQNDEVAKKACVLVREYRMELVKKRLFIETLWRIISCLENYIGSNEMSELQAFALRTRLLASENAADAKQWFSELMSRKNKQAKEAHAKLLLSAKCEVPVEQELAMSKEECDISVAFHEKRASECESRLAKKFYKDGLMATDRRVKKRLFKRAIHEENIADRPVVVVESQATTES